MGSADRLKVHRHGVALDGRATTILRLRPSTTQRFATNHFHDTWHILSDLSGGHLLGRLCWALSYQRQPNTFVVIDEPELVVNPFDADRSNTIVVCNSALGPFNATMAKGLTAWLRTRKTSEGTSLLQSFGLDGALSDVDAFRESDEQAYWRQGEQQNRTWIDRVNSCVVLAAPPPVLRAWGVALSQLGEWMWQGMSYTELDWPMKNGEVQVFENFHAMGGRAGAARTRLFPGSEHRTLTEAERLVVWESSARNETAT